ncbi:hypothetical protein N7447_002978 [Penicillium robsamsonii]|uniref:uncharacterized protein n=1 Tax=Penicillium robsamsonii TaxID=1792511 RepID=UPI0025484F2A|nr:uncharacterized protein N7447_002978 [Penicillium robsamsonii]KAJ5836952.1 hypothetical protein N7447_002978 [Penicillium robsamsonii]
MEKLNQAVSGALAHNSIRILVPAENLNGKDYLASTGEIIASFVDFWKENASVRILAVKNDGYDYDNTHIQVVVILSTYSDCLENAITRQPFDINPMTRY